VRRGKPIGKESRVVSVHSQLRVLEHKNGGRVGEKGLGQKLSGLLCHLSKMSASRRTEEPCCPRGKKKIIEDWKVRSKWMTENLGDGKGKTPTPGPFKKLDKGGSQKRRIRRS